MGSDRSTACRRLRRCDPARMHVRFLDRFSPRRHAGPGNTVLHPPIPLLPTRPPCRPTPVLPPLPARAMSPARLKLLAYLALAVVLIVLDHRGGWLTPGAAPGHAAGAAAVDGRRLARARGRAHQRRRRHADPADRRKPPPAQRPAAQPGAHGAPADAWRPTTRACAACSTPPSAASSTCSCRRSSTSTSTRPASAWCSMPAAATACSVGQSVIDAGGLLGQIIAVTPMYANVLLLTDPVARRAGGGGAQRRAPGRLRRGPQRPAARCRACRCRATSRSATCW